MAKRNWITDIGIRHRADRLTNVEVRAAVQWLRDRDIEEFKDGTYHCFYHPNVEADILSDPRIANISFARYSDNPLLKGAVPSAYGVSFFRTVEVPSIEKQDYVITVNSSFAINDTDEFIVVFKGSTG